MVGNDIIDLKLALDQSNWRRNGFLNKIFTDEEQHVIFTSENPFEIVWLFWSMKESAYKVHVQKYQHRFYAPKKFKCQLISETKGFVVIDDECYHTTSKINNDFIFTEADLTNNMNLVNNCVEFKNASHTNHRKQLYDELKSQVSRNLNIPVAELYIKKNTIGIPKLYQQNEQLETSISISHHGRYGAFSISNTF